MRICPKSFLGRLRLAIAPIEAKRADHEARLRELADRWDALAANDQAERTTVLGALRERVLERNYINNLLATIEREATGPQL